MTNKINSNLFKLVLHYHKSINQVLQDYERLLSEYKDEEEALIVLEDYYKQESDKYE